MQRRYHPPGHCHWEPMETPAAIPIGIMKCLMPLPPNPKPDVAKEEDNVSEEEK